MSKIRVLHVTNHLELAGTEITLEMFCRDFDKSCFEAFACGRMCGVDCIALLERSGIPVSSTA